MAKPSSVPLWASTGTKVEPSTGVKAAGWAPNQRPPAQWFNWWMYLVYTWCVWLDAFEGTAHTWTAKQTFSTGGVEFAASGSDVVFDDGFHSLGAAQFDLNVSIGTDLAVGGGMTIAGLMTLSGGLLVSSNSIFGGAGHTHQHAFQGDVSISGDLLAAIHCDFANPLATAAIPNTLQPITTVKAAAMFTCNGTTTPAYNDGHGIAGITQHATNGLVTITFATPFANLFYQAMIGAVCAQSIGANPVILVEATDPALGTLRTTNTMSYFFVNATTGAIYNTAASGGNQFRGSVSVTGRQ